MGHINIQAKQIRRTKKVKADMDSSLVVLLLRSTT
ncbi:hypothetical protein CCACVL1_00463 [Corchorus capsularis]|uniref:Uncharacterized protein n=1 Tax=Corchorus capsularis TaxID=210143 RepID=A0A1R3KWQ8_COCAP|nr:hypothetical protein CCACVL1_00463 [Corchorus capsularis]